MTDATDSVRPLHPPAPTRDTIHKIYLYHLARSGSPWDARDLTARTFQTASASIHTYRPARTSYTTWLFRIARYQQRYTPPRGNRVRQHSENPVDPDQYFPGDDHQVALRAVIADLAADLRQLSPLAADAFALHVLAGLNLDESAEILDQPPDALERILAETLERLRIRGGADWGQALDASAASRLLPEEDLVRSIQQDWAGQTPPDRAPLISRLPGDPWAALYRLRTGLSWSLRLVPVILVAAVLVYGFTRGKPSAPDPAPAGIPSTGKTLPGVEGGARQAGILAPPDAEFCQIWQGIVTQVLVRPAALEEDIPFTDPVSAGPDRSGRGCAVQASGTGVDFGSTRQTLDQFISLLTRTGFEQMDEYTCTCGVPGNDLFGNDWYGSGVRFRRDDLQAVLSVSWRPTEPGVCPTAQPEAGCAVPPDRQAFSFRLVLARDGLKPFLDTYMKHWEKGENQALSFLSDPLRKKVLDIPALDAAAGVQHNAVANPTFTWQLSGFSAGRPTIKVTAYEWIEYSVPLLVAINFHMELRPDGNAWAIDTITPY